MNANVTNQKIVSKFGNEILRYENIFEVAFHKSEDLLPNFLIQTS